MTRCFDKFTKKLSVASWEVKNYAWSTIWNFIDLMLPQRPLTEKVLKFNMSFHDSVNFFFKTSKWNDVSPKIIELLRTWKTLKSTKMIFQALETSPASFTSEASATLLASIASKAQFSQNTSWSWWIYNHWHQNNQYWSFFQFKSKLTLSKGGQ